MPDGAGVFACAGLALRKSCAPLSGSQNRRRRFEKNRMPSLQISRCPAWLHSTASSKPPNRALLGRRMPLILMEKRKCASNAAGQLKANARNATAGGGNGSEMNAIKRAILLNWSDSLTARACDLRLANASPGKPGSAGISAGLISVQTRENRIVSNENESNEKRKRISRRKR